MNMAPVPPATASTTCEISGPSHIRFLGQF